MPQSLHQVCGHIVFSTKDRQPMIHGDIEKKLHACLGGIVRDLEATPVAINGMPDHVHLLIRAGKKVADTEFIRQVKGSSSKWMGEQGVEKFRWQGGSGWFGVSANDLPRARRYVEQQKEHHGVMTFQEEFRKFFVKCGIEFDERHVCD